MMHPATVDAVLAMLEAVENEHRSVQATTDDPYTQAQSIAKIANTDRIRREVLILAGRTEEPITEDEDGPDDPHGIHLPHGDVYRDGGWEDTDGFPVPFTTAPDCDRTCLPCQGHDHAACAMGCHDGEG